MLFLYRPRQTWMPFRRPQARTQQAAYNRQLQERFAATQQLPPSPPSPELPARRDVVSELQAIAALHAAGALTDDELAAAKARVLADPATT